MKTGSLAAKIERDHRESTKERVPVTCVHLGERIRTEDGGLALVECPGCQSVSGQPNRKALHVCDVFGQCVTAGNPVGVATCAGCERKQLRASTPYGRAVIRNLLFHIGPFKGNGTWQRNVEQLRRRMNLFNGRRVVAIVTGGNLDHPDDVKRAFGGDVSDYIVVPNNPSLREVATFTSLLERVQSVATNEVTFHAHAKGVQHPVNASVTVHPWTDVMYETCLDYWPMVERLLLSHPCAGSFKKIGRFFSGDGSQSAWHYSGTFFWTRSCMTFNRDWRKIDLIRFGSEAWPGLHFDIQAAAAIFYEGNGYDLYLMDFWKGTILPAYEKWKVAHASERRSV